MGAIQNRERTGFDPFDSSRNPAGLRPVDGLRRPFLSV